ncbi:MAG: CPBP family intramembrane metalloprotease [Mycobacterium sp.]|uniref:CPBP family intramembrane glutamic endopeptidase n=1 Tax=Mycobacterium sp. TaxID=1785 RepID=UPI0026119F00|nr:CPBP family intramembrane glutamic endopeptidase [Mycobacterium sp.]MDI3314101.1 CPBP family intramembrane metalloprotease [Mycobacterium sp.]
MSTPYRATVRDELRRALTNVAVPHHEPPSVVRRRRIVVAITLPIGAAVLGLSLRCRPGEPGFYWLVLVLGAVWAAGALVSGPLHLGGICWRGRNQRPVITGTTVGLALGGLFLLGAVIARQLPPLAELLTQVLQFARQGSLPLVAVIAVADAIAEEMFYRGALYTALGRHYPVTISTILSVVTAMVGGNPMLGFAAAVLGSVCGFERRVTGGVLAPILTHVMWSLLTVLTLPMLFSG